MKINRLLNWMPTPSRPWAINLHQTRRLTYYNRSRVHQSLDGVTPNERSGKSRCAIAAFDAFGWKTHCRGLFQTPVAV
jgi:hypothetical protein